MLQLIGLLNPDRNNFVRFFEEFQYMGRTCLVFEILEKNLNDLIKERNNQPLSLREIRPVAKQLLVALKTLWNVGVLHTDIKPDNVMLVNSKEQPLRIKLIDFGLAILISKAKPGMLTQPIGYRAPEITLGLPFTEAIDVWGVGCTLAFLYLADNLFPVDCDFQMMKCIVQVLGQPQDRLLNGGIYTHNFFKKADERLNELTWRLMTSEEYKAVDNRKTKTRKASFDLPSSLDVLVNIYPTQNFGEMEDKLAFVDLLKQLLHLDGRLRISAYQALNLPFITMTHITSPFSRAYLRVSQNVMAVCSDDKSVERMRSCSCPDFSYCDKEPESGFYEEVTPHLHSDEQSDEWISEAELSSVCSNTDTAAGFSCRAESDGTSTDGLTTPSDVSRSFDGELKPVSLHLRPDLCLFCRDQALDNPTDGHNSPSLPTDVSADRDLKPVSVAQTPAPCVSVGVKTPSAHEPVAPPSVQSQPFGLWSRMRSCLLCVGAADWGS
ncbi:homeodomain-interacting protein kinase 3-like isoform X2 [Nelusetta ayraudi]